MLVARLSSEVTKIGYERHMLFTNRFTEYAPMHSLDGPSLPAYKAEPAYACPQSVAMHQSRACVFTDCADMGLVHVLLQQAPRIESCYMR